MTTVKFPLVLPSDARDTTAKDSSSEAEDAENIPYHAREYARPFTYGNLPKGFHTSQLNHVAVEEPIELSKNIQIQALPPASPTTLRKSTRPSISPSRPVLRKTPSRQEFEEMLMERREQALREQNTIATKMAQNAAIQKDLDQLQEKLNKNGVLSLKTGESTDAKSARDTPVVAGVGEGRELVVASNGAKYDPLPFAAGVEAKRSETPTFPLQPRAALEERCVSPYPMVTPGTPTLQRIHPAICEFSEKERPEESFIKCPVVTVNEPQAVEPQAVEPHLVKFAKDSSEFWYKPHMSRAEAMALLRNAVPGTFIIRNSTTYKNAYGLVLRVAQPPPGIVVLENSGGDELVRHYLLEPTASGVRLKGCANEPTFTSLSALVYQHSINQLALPCKLLIPSHDLLQLSGDMELISAQKQLLTHGAACNVLYLFTCNMESLTGDEAIRKAVFEMYAQRPLPTPIEVHFKVSQPGVTLTDNKRRLFFRRHYTGQNISHFAIDPDNRVWHVAAKDEGLDRDVKKTIFAFVARPTTGAKDNQCHVFCDLAANQPASAIVSFAHKVLPLDKQSHRML